MIAVPDRPDVVLFNPAPRTGWQVQRRIELPLSLLFPATPLLQAGYRVQIIDEFAQRDWRSRLCRAIEHRPICFGVTCMTGPQILHAIEGCRLVRQRHADLPIVWGGVHASLMPEQTLASAYADIVVVGEGEATLLDLVRTLAAGEPLAQVAGIVFRQDGRCQRTERREFIDLDSLPPLAYQLVDLDNYRRRLFGIDHISLNTSRGCPYACKFCWDPILHARRWRAMRPATVLERLRQIVHDHNIRGFLFVDDHFFVDLDRAREILEGVVRANLDLSISKLQIRADTICRLDKEFFELLVRARVRRLSVGVESGSQRLLDMIGKELRIEQVIQANRLLKDYPIVPVFLFMMGLPTETPEEFGQSVRLAVQLTEENPNAVKTFNIYTPYPGTELYDLTVKMGLRPPERLEDWAAFNFRNVFRHSPWIEPQTRRLVEGLDFPLMFLGQRSFAQPFKKTHPLAVGLARLYWPLARYRIHHLDPRWPLESKLVKAIGLFGRQD